MNNTVLKARNLTKVYVTEKTSLKVLHGINLDIYEGESVAILGGSGTGKSTLMHILGTLDQPTSGDLQFAGRSLIGMKEKAKADFRNKNLGFVFQFHHLLLEFSALENVMMPLLIRKTPTHIAEKKAQELLYQVGLKHRVNHYPSEMSGGEQQRVAVARALITEPKLLLADEPTGNLDQKNSQQIRELMLNLVKMNGSSLITVSHDPTFVEGFNRILKISDGEWSIESLALASQVL